MMLYPPMSELAAKAGSRYLLVNLVAQLFDAAERYRRYSASHRKASRRKHDEHQELMASILSRNVPQAEALLRQHILSTQTMVTQALALMQAA